MIEKIASAMGDLKDSPALLAIVLLQAATLAVIYMVSTGNAERTATRELALIAACQEKKE